MSINISCSRNANLTLIKFAKYLSKLLNLNYFPRGKGPLKNIFNKLNYLGCKYFILIKKNRLKSISILIYKNKDNSFYPEREYLIDLIDLRSFKSFKAFIPIKIKDSKNLFYFLDKNKKTVKSDFELFYENDFFEFRFQDVFLGIKFKLLKVIMFD
ncbi:MAG: hypothetical protein PHR26_00325 [Candidatus ainarchaeum sp.]|nr:hypothetical protein [Candidatus ainarchaeum sp.]MDD3975660.1 hypothetical protein [Candidatus ainarchaeum sp.]